MKNLLFTIALLSSFCLNSIGQLNCCSDFEVTAEFSGCNVEICFSQIGPKGGICEGDITFLYSIIDSNGEQVEFGSTGSPCFLWTGGIPGETYTISGYVYYPWECIDDYNDITPLAFTIPEDCGDNCCPDLTANVTFDGCIATICFEPANPYEDFCDLGFTAIVGRIITLNGQVIEQYNTSTNCFTFSGGVPGESYQVKGRIDYPYDCDTTDDIVPNVFTIPETCDGCDAPHDIICDIEDGIMSLEWEGPQNVVEYRVEINLYIEGVSCCEGTFNQDAPDYITTVPSIPDMSQLTNLTCYVLRIISVCNNGYETSTDWICFPFSDHYCPNDLPAQEKEVSETRSNNVILENEITLYPNPSYSSIELFGSSLKHGNTVSIYNSVGTLISKDKVINDNSFYKDVKHLKPSTYMVIVSNEYGETVSKKRFVKH